MPNEDGFVKVNIDTRNAKNWKPVNKDDSVQGIYVDKQTDVGPNKSNTYTLQQADGSFISFWGNYTIDQNMNKIPLGAEVKIIYLGKKTNPKTNRQFHDYDFYSKEVKAPATPVESESKSSEDVDPSDVPF